MSKFKGISSNEKVELAKGPIPYPNIRISNPDAVRKRVRVPGSVKLSQPGQFVSSMGDEATASNGGLVSNHNLGKTFVSPGPVNVMVEGKNVARQFDLMVSGPGAPALAAQIQATSAATTDLKLKVSDGASGQVQIIDLKSAEVQNDPVEKAKAVQEANSSAGAGSVKASDVVVLKVTM